jgi:hypothetical protein
MQAARSSVLIVSGIQRDINLKTRQFERCKRLPFVVERQSVVDSGIKSLPSLKHPLFSPTTRFDLETGAVNIWSLELPASLATALADDSKPLSANSVLIALYGVATALQWLPSSGTPARSDMVTLWCGGQTSCVACSASDRG